MAMDLKDIMQQAKALQSRLSAAQAEVANIEVTGESGAGLVKVTLTGRYEARRVEIDPAAFSGDRELLQGLIAGAITDAARRVESEQKSRLSALGQGLGLPAGFKLPL